MQPAHGPFQSAMCKIARSGPALLTADEAAALVKAAEGWNGQLEQDSLDGFYASVVALRDTDDRGERAKAACNRIVLGRALSALLGTQFIGEQSRCRLLVENGLRLAPDDGSPPPTTADGILALLRAANVMPPSLVQVDTLRFNLNEQAAALAHKLQSGFRPWAEPASFVSSSPWRRAPIPARPGSPKPGSSTPSSAFPSSASL